MKYLVVAVILAVSAVSHASNVEWTRFKGKVKNVNGKASTVTIQNGEGDLVTIKVTEDVTILSGRDVVGLGKVRIDDKVTLLYEPRAPEAKDAEEPEPGGFYPPAKRP
jgi:hypothetical protein